MAVGGQNYQQKLRTNVAKAALESCLMLDWMFMLMQRPRDSELQDICGKLLRWLQCPHLEINAAAMHCLVQLSKMDSEDGTDAFPAKMLILMTNAVANRSTVLSAMSIHSEHGLGNNTNYSITMLLYHCCEFFMSIHTDDPVYTSMVEKKIGVKMVSAHQELTRCFEEYNSLLDQEERRQLDETIGKMATFLISKGILQ